MHRDFSTADLFDSDPAGVSLVELDLRGFGGRPRFSGRCVTLRLPAAHHGPLREILSRPGEGRVLVADAGGDRRNALLGDRIATLAVGNGWAGIVINGVVRDTRALAGLDIGLRALGTTARRSADPEPEARGNETFALGGALIGPDCWIYADEDAVLVSRRDLLGG